MKARVYVSSALVRVVACIVTALLAATTSAQPTPAEPPTQTADVVEAPVEAPFESARPGWNVSVGIVGAYLNLELRDTLPFETLGIDLAERGGGLQLQVGYAFAPGFGLEIAIGSTEHETGRPDVRARFHQLQIDAIAPVVRTGRVLPYVAGGLGGAGLELRGAGIDNTIISGAQIQVGGGIDVLLSKHTALTVLYRFAIQDFREKTIETPGAATTFDVDARGESHTWGLRFSWSF